jgi:hypothetical protein
MHVSWLLAVRLCPGFVFPAGILTSISDRHKESAPTGWAGGHSGTTITACVVCAFGIGPTAGPEQTLIGGTGSGAYPNANGSIAGNDPHNPFLVGTLTLTLSVPGVTVNSTFSNVVIQFGTEATPPQTQQTPEPATMLLLGTGLIGAAAGFRKRFGRK